MDTIFLEMAKTSSEFENKDLRDAAIKLVNGQAKSYGMRVCWETMTVHRI